MREATTDDLQVEASPSLAGSKPGFEAASRELLNPTVMLEALVRGNAFNAAYRDYTGTNIWRSDCVAVNYQLNHRLQTFQVSGALQEEHCRFGPGQGKGEMSLWEALDLLEEVIDDSDPDTDLPQAEHLFQTAEACRAWAAAVGPAGAGGMDADTWAVVGLVHDAGKVLAHPRFGQLPQWAVVGDTFPLGCAFDPAVVHHAFFADNPDACNATYSSAAGVYTPGCGLAAVRMSFGHDEYFYQVCKANGVTLPHQALQIIRFHSFYALHQGGAYTHLLDQSDRELVHLLQAFQKCDLYSKSDQAMDLPRLREEYRGLVDRFFPPTLRW